MNFESRLKPHNMSEEDLRKILHNFFKGYEVEFKNKKHTQNILAKICLLMDDKNLKQIITSKRVEYIITSGNNEELKELQTRISKL